MAKLSLKKNISSMQVIKTLQMLLQGNFTMNELIEKLNAEESEPIFNNSVISKYINTCRICGIDIPKIHNKYFVASMPFGLELTINDINLLENFQNVVRGEMTSRYNKIFDNFLDKLNRFSNKKIARVEKDSHQASTELFERAVYEKRKIKLMFKNRIELVCIPVKIIDGKTRTLFHVNCNGKDRMIGTERVSGIEVLSEKFVKNHDEKSVLFILKGTLAQRYKLRENEHIVNPYDGESMTVSNENKHILFSRLLRYDKYCEVVTPKPYREEMCQLIDDMLSNYGV